MLCDRIRHVLLTLLALAVVTACGKKAPPAPASPPAADEPPAATAPKVEDVQVEPDVPERKPGEYTTDEIREMIQAPDNVAAAPDDAEKTESGLASKVLRPGKGGARPHPQDRVVVHYVGWTSAGRLVDTTLTREPRGFRLDKVIAGWSEGIQLMTMGERRRFWIPGELAYKGRKGKPQGMLVFDVELLELQRAPAAPPDVAKPPADAKRTKSGIYWKELSPGTGKVHPKKTSTVMVEYSGWTTDGTLFDSSILQGEPTMFQLEGVIEGWTEGLQLMVEGQKMRFWIPQKLAYKGKKGRPKGMLVFDVEMLRVLN